MNKLADDYKLTRQIVIAFVALFVLMVVGAIVITAIDADMLWPLVAGLVVIAVASITAAVVVVGYVAVPLLDSRLARDKARYDHDVRMLEIEAKRQPLSLPAPTSGSAGIQFDSGDPRSLAVNLLLFSVRLLGDKSGRIASGPECAGANIIGYSQRKWEYAVNLLKRDYGVVTVQGGVANGGGAFVPESIGTVRALYDRVILSSAVNALPEVER